MSDTELLVRMLSSRDTISEEEQQRLAALPKHRRSFAKGETIVASHSTATESCMLVSGLAGREIVVTDGGRQITALQLPGDFLDLHGMLLKLMDHSVIALTDCQATFVAHRDLLALIDEAPHLGRLLWLSTLIDAAIQRNWTVGMGRRNALAQMAHLICELYLRLEAVGLAEGRRMQLPLSQPMLADILGLSAVHVNRTLQVLRNRQLVSWEAGAVVIRDFPSLAELADFDATYLHLVHTLR